MRWTIRSRRTRAWGAGATVCALAMLIMGTARRVSATPQPDDRVGVLVIAHGGNNQWNATVRKTVRQAKLPFSTELALGMGMHDQEIRLLQQAVDRLERKGVNKIVVVPLLVSSYSEVFRQYEYLFRLRPEGEWNEVSPLSLEVPVVMGRALDGHPVVMSIVAQRAKDLSAKPAEETVVLIAHGPVTDRDDQVWLDHLQRVAQFIKEQQGFRDVLAMTIRDDAPKAVKDQAIRRLRAVVEVHSRGGRVLVVPVLMARGGIERKIPRMLNGLSYVYKGQTLLPDPLVATWIAEEATELATQEEQASVAVPTEPDVAEPSAATPYGTDRSVTPRPTHPSASDAQVGGGAAAPAVVE